MTLKNEKDRIHLKIIKIAKLLLNLSDTDKFWKSVNKHYTKQYCFKEHSFDDIITNYEIARDWYTKQMNLWKSKKIYVDG